MTKTSLDYEELVGLQIALDRLKNPPKPDTQYIIGWMELRIKELESK